MDGSDGKLETGAEVEARRAVRAEDGEARLPAEVQVAEEERPGGVAGRRGRSQTQSFEPDWKMRPGAQTEGEVAFACSGLISVVESPAGAENNSERNRQQKRNGDCQQ